MQQILNQADRKKIARKEAARTRRKVIAQGVECVICGFWFHSVLRQHHIVPVERGGTSSPENMVFLCPNCHAFVHEMAVRLRDRVSGERFYEIKRDLLDLYDEYQVGMIIDYGNRAK